MTALTVYPSNIAASTIATAGKLSSTTGGTASSCSTKIGTATGYGQLYALTNSNAWPALGSIGSPDGNGFLWDVTTLVGNTLAAGNWTPTIRVRISGGTATADFYVRIYKYNGGTYTFVGTCIATGNNLTSGFLNLTFNNTSLGSMDFATGDKLYIDVWSNITTNGTGSSSATMIMTVSDSGTQGVTTELIVTPGYDTTSVVNANNMGGIESNVGSDLLLKTDNVIQPPAQLPGTVQGLVMAWIYPGDPACNAPSEYSDGRVISVLKPEYFSLGNNGVLTELTEDANGCNAYSAANVADVKSYSDQQFVTISGTAAGFNTLVGSSTLTTNFINTLTNFLTNNGLTGVEFDFEGFGTWTATNYSRYKTLCTTVGNSLHSNGFKLMIDGPAIPNATYQGYFLWKYEDFNSLPVDYICVMAYDFMFDNGAGTPVASLADLTASCNWAMSKITNPARLVIGLNNYGYHGTTDGYSFTIDTYAQSQSLPGFGTATRNSSSGEMVWAQGGVSYNYSDQTTLDGKKTAVYATGLDQISVWHLGGNLWFSPDPPSEPPQAQAQDIGRLQRWPVDVLIGKDSVFFLRSALSVDALTGSDRLLATYNATLVDTNTGSDIGGMSPDAPIVINANEMGGIDILIISDLGKLQRWSIDGLTISDFGFWQGSYVGVDVLFAGDQTFIPIIPVPPTAPLTVLDNIIVSGGGSCLPITIPPFSYSMNSVLLDVPYLASGIAVQGNFIPTRASFQLIWRSASVATQNALGNGAIGIMTFAAGDGSKVQGLVQIKSSVSGLLFIAIMTTLQSILVDKRVIVTQFY